MRGTLPCTPSCIQAKPEDAARESRSDLSFSNFSAGIARRIERSSLPLISAMVNSSLAGTHVQPCPRIKIELLAISSWLLAEPNLGLAKS